MSRRVSTTGGSGGSGSSGPQQTTTTSSFTQPAVGSTVDVAVTSTAWMFVGQYVFVAGGGLYQVTAIGSGTSVTLRNLGDGASAAAAATVSTSASVFGAGYPKVTNWAEVLTDQSTNSSSYTDLSTVGPVVTLVTGASVICHIDSRFYQGTLSGAACLAVAVSGATPQAASDSLMVFGNAQTTTNRNNLAGEVKLTGLTPGTNVFTLKYRTEGATYNFVYRRLRVTAF